MFGVFFVKQTCEIKSQISVNKVLDIEQNILKSYLKRICEMILSLNSSPTPFSLCMCPYPKTGRLKIPQFLRPIFMDEIIKEKKKKAILGGFYI